MGLGQLSAELGQLPGSAAGPAERRQPVRLGQLSVKFSQLSCSLLQEPVTALDGVRYLAHLL